MNIIKTYKDQVVAKSLGYNPRFIYSQKKLAKTGEADAKFTCY